MLCVTGRSTQIPRWVDGGYFLMSEKSRSSVTRTRSSRRQMSKIVASGWADQAFLVDGLGVVAYAKK